MLFFYLSFFMVAIDDSINLSVHIFWVLCLILSSIIEIKWYMIFLLPLLYFSFGLDLIGFLLICFLKKFNILAFLFPVIFYYKKNIPIFPCLLISIIIS